MANRNRTKGHDAERLYAQKFRELGYGYCETSRYASRKHDDCKIDLVNTAPFNVQIKAGAQRGMNPSKVLADMKEACGSNFPPESAENSNINIVIHHKDVGKGKKRTAEHSLAVLTVDDLMRLINKLRNK